MEHVTVKDLVLGSGGVLVSGREEAPVSHIRLDSRQVEPGDLFVPLLGERVDSHPEDGAGCAVIRVEDTKKALQKIGSYLRDRLTLPLVGVTGSVGKTTTREMIAAALSARFRVYKTPGNSNSQVGVPVTLSEITENDQVGVIELGMSEPGEMTVIAKIARVDMAVITNIGITHIGQLGSQ